MQTVNEKEFEKQAQFVSWCIEEYAVQKNKNSKDVANYFNEKGVLDFLIKHWEVLHTQSKSYILESIEDFIATGE